MSMIMIPADSESETWPTLGPGVCAFIEDNLVFGPGDLEGQQAKLDPEKRALIYRFYEVFPENAKDPNGRPIGGRRRFRRCAISLQKGSAKTELAAWIAAAELHPDAPVRFNGTFVGGEPEGRGVMAPYIPLVAYSEEQVEDLGYNVFKTILEHSRIAGDFDIGLERVMRIGGDGKVVALAGAPDSRDGALTTFDHKDETHRWHLERLKRAHRTMLANLPKRYIAEPWSLETTTAYEPGQNSVAEETAAYAQDVLEGKISDSRLFFFHRQASDGYDWSDSDERRKALTEAAGPTAAWKDITGIEEQWQDPKADREYLERVYGNRPIASASKAFNIDAWRRNARPDVRIAPKRPIALGLDGSLSEDSTGLIAHDLELNFEWPLGIWEKDGPDWRVPRDEVEAAVLDAFEVFHVVRFYADPSKWEAEVASWAGRFGAEVVFAYSTTLYRKMAAALKAYAKEIEEGDVTHNGDPVFEKHIGNAHKNIQNFRDDDDSPMWLIRKDRAGSPNKIDAAMAGTLAAAAARDAIKSGALRKTVSVYKDRGVLVMGEPVEDDEEDEEAEGPDGRWQDWPDPISEDEDE